MRALRTSLATLAVLVALPAAAHAAAFTVNDTGDDADAAPGDGQCATSAHVCTLRAAVEEINAQGDASNTITLPAGTIHTHGGLPIDANMVITGQGSSATIIDATNLDTSDPVFDGSQQTLELAALTVTNASAGVVGGSLTGLTLRNAAITGNAGDPVIDLAPTGAGAAMVVDHSSITKNTGQTIDVDPSNGDGTLTMRDSVFSDNAPGEAGASQLIDIDPSDGNGTLTIQRSTMERNTIADSAQGIIDFDPSGDTLVRFVEEGAEVFHEEDAARTLFVLESGALDIVKRKGDGEVQLSRIRPGESFGEMSFIDMQPRSATVRAAAASTLWVWPYSAFHDRYCKDSKCYTLLVMNLARELSRRLRRADDLIASAKV